MAKITYAHARDHAVVAFSGALDWDASRELVDLIQVLVDEYFYTDVEIVVTSDGGSVRAFEHYLARQAEWRRRGVTLRTRVVSEAASAAAILVSLGDERVAEPGATLAFHCLQAAPSGAVNSGTTAAISSALRGMDDDFVRRLAERGLRGRAEVAPGSERTDSVLLPQLWPEFGRPDRGVPVLGKRGPLTRALGRHVDRAIRRRNRKALGRLYRRLFEIDCTISARLALTLRLIDRIGVPSPKGAEAARSSGLRVPEWGVLFPPDGLVPREVLCRHALVLGETGSGKTASCILPVAAAMARAPRAQLGAALIIDPKRELAPTLRGLAPERVHEVRADRVALNVMTGPRWSLDEDLAAKRWSSAARRILSRVASFVPTNPARVLLDHSVGDSNAEFFNREGTALALSVLAFVLLLIDPRTPPTEDWIDDDVDAYVWVEELRERARSERGPNAVALAAWCLDGPLVTWPVRHARPLVLDVTGRPSSPEAEWLFARIARDVLARLCGGSAEGRDLCERILGYWTAMGDIDRQFAGVRATASVVCSDFAAPAIASTLYVGCEPAYRAAHARGDGLDFARLAAPDAPGKLVVFQPARDQLDNLIAIALKALFFEAVLDDPDRAKGGSALPLVGYVADEFHRFVTSDPLHGEQSFLDSCRSFGAFCLLACQSVASIEHALAHGGGTAAQNRSSVEILLSNTATKFAFRSTHPSTAHRVLDLGPQRPGRPGVAEVRPVSALRVGEAYIALSDGRFERRQLEPFVAPGEAPAPTVALLEGPRGTGGRS